MKGDKSNDKGTEDIDDVNDTDQSSEKSKTKARTTKADDTQEEAEGEGVDVPHEFQQSVHNLTKGANKHMLKHMHTKANDREDEIRQEEMKKDKKGKTEGELSTEGMPSSSGY